MKVHVIGDKSDIYWINGAKPWGLEKFSIALPDLIVFTSGERISRLLTDDINSKYLTNEARDVLELGEYAIFKMMGIPILGINRGAHLLHVANGGILAPIDNHCGLETHKIKLIDDFMYVNSVHEQKMVKAGEKECITLAWSEDQLSNEALYYPKNNCLCIQWNPELMSKTSKCVKVTNQLIKEYLINGN